MKRLVAIIIIYCFCNGANAQNAVDFITIENSPNVELGRGFNEIEQRVAGGCVEFTEQTEELTFKSDGSLRTVAHMSVEETDESIHRMRSYAARANGSYYGFTADGGFSRVQENISGKYYLYATYILSIVAPPINIKAEQLKPSVIPKVVDGKISLSELRSFVSQCGHGYISSLNYGGSIMIGHVVEVDNEYAKEVFKADLSASYAGIIGGSANIEEFEKVTRNKKIVNTFSITAGPFSQPPTETNELINYIKNIQTEISGKSMYPLSGSLLGYATLLPELKSNESEASTIKRRVAQLEETKRTIENKITKLTKVLNDSGRYDVRDSELLTLKDKAEELEQATNELIDKIGKCLTAIEAKTCHGIALIPPVSIPKKLPNIEDIEGACLKENHRFVTNYGGCQDVTNGIVWGAPSKSVLTYDEANKSCTTSRANGEYDWRLPTRGDFLSLERAAGATGSERDYIGFREYKSFWTFERQRYSINTRATKDETKRTSAKYRSVCVRGTTS